MKDKFTFQMQEMVEKGKGKLTLEIIERYVDSLNHITQKNCQIKQLKEELAQSKKKDSGQKVGDEKAILQELSALERKMLEEKGRN